jgi:O-antigen ligase
LGADLIRIFLALLIALIGADRIDILNGSGPFILTPFITLSSITIFLGITLSRLGSSVIPKKKTLLPTLLSILLIFIAISVIFGDDIDLGTKRFCLLTYQIFYSMLLLNFLKQTKNFTKIIVIASYLGIIFHFLFCITELLNWSNGMFTNISFINLKSHTIGPFSPRLSGASLDPNRGGLLLVAYSFFLIEYSVSSKLRNIFLIISTLLVLTSLSRTAISAYLLTALLIFYQKMDLLTVIKKLPYLLIVLPIVALILLFFSNLNNSGATINYKKVFDERTSFSYDTSGGIHLDLLNRAIELTSSSPKHFLIGVGFGSSHYVLKEFFHTNKYANFHSIYLSMLVESGFFSLMLFLFISFLPLLFNKNYIPIIIGTAFFNLFYQLTLEPIFWLLIFLSWDSSLKIYHLKGYNLTGVHPRL